ncbi:hypothetical protein VOLCADRAFT_94330 [Volvox carteri f. nagariensis]|uniref:UBA domain-containing protein n=1 Tax=Volvox carteri f. nagariensis TaxID=3068 RepID=D8U476_VOLCA|nr:uncharacterized protein VOLCADRAFT_94330 [Volvox carteri f. nagariensis]EFJ45454.1 hypothetical protein VOLCADRAFT_94330 [Volvox carteri f. nagariensis]|eukprot:XP_002953481.1 hypothetical protein VOLCADRAFT_94330 [Volvox carteri f. nagariensis]
MYSYPQRPGAMSPAPSSAFAQPQQHQQPVYVPPPPPVATPVPGLCNAPSGSITTLRLKLSEDIRIEPPALACPDLSRERQLVEGPRRGLQGQGDKAGSGSPDVDAYLARMKPGEVPQDPAILQLVAKGMSQAAAALGVVYGRAGRGGAEKAAEFASCLEQLTTMGFPLPLAAGALAKHKLSLEAATESCLATAN